MIFDFLLISMACYKAVTVVFYFGYSNLCVSSKNGQLKAMFSTWMNVWIKNVLDSIWGVFYHDVFSCCLSATPPYLGNRCMHIPEKSCVSKLRRGINRQKTEWTIRITAQNMKRRIDNRAANTKWGEDDKLDEDWLKGVAFVVFENLLA